MENVWRRRDFLASSLMGIGVSSWGGAACGQSESPALPTEVAAATEQGATKQGAAPETLFLTWQRDPTTTITVQWLDQNTSAGDSVLVTKRDASTWTRHPAVRRAYQKTELTLKRCEITGLEPDTEYQLRVSRTKEILRFRTMPAQATDAIQFVSGGDSGIGKAAVQNNQIASRQNPRFAFLGGDLAYDNGRSPDTFTTFLKNWHSQMVDADGRLIPMVSCPGNHEVDGGASTDRANAPQYLSFFDGFYPERSYGVLDIGDYFSLVMLDTGHLSPIAGEQTDWLEKTLREREGRQHVIVAYHVPAYPSYRATEGADGKPGTGHLQRTLWCPLFERYKIDLVLEHHDHTFKRSHPLTNGLYDRHGVLYLGDGSWGKLRPLNEPSLRPYLAKASSDNHVTVHRLEGDTRFHVALNDIGRVTDVCQTVSKRPSLRG